MPEDAGAFAASHTPFRARAARLALAALMLSVGPLGAPPAPAAAATENDPQTQPVQTAAKQAYERATAAFGLGHYKKAGAAYEEAFALKPDPALLFNAAQAYRLGGDAERALELYRNYVRIYGLEGAGESAQEQIEALTHLVASQKQSAAGAASAAPNASKAPDTTNTAGTGAPEAGDPGTAPLPTASRASEEALLDESATASPERAPEQPSHQRSADSASLLESPWFWVGAVAAVAAAGVAVGLLTSGDQTETPTPTWGTIELGINP